MRNLISAVICSGISITAWAMEPMSDDSLSTSTGQAGISVAISSVGVQASHIRYYDSDGDSALGFPGHASLDVANFNLSMPNGLLFTLDVGSTGSGSSAKTGILLGTSAISNMSITTGAISVDDGNEMVAGTHSSTFASVSLTNINLSALRFLVTPGGAIYKSGLTIASLAPIDVTANLAVNDLINGGVIGSALSVQNLMAGAVSLDVTNSAVSLSYGNTYVGMVAANGVRVGASTTPDMGNFTVYGLNVPASSILISGH